jgi:predicted enzyme related to lactoylglutathione lyase
MKRVTGIGGVFFKSTDPEASRNWYQKHLGLQTDAYGSSFEWRESEHPDRKAYTQWSPFSKDTGYFAPSEKEFMINYRVADLEGLILELKKEGVTILDEIESFEYGKFLHIMDLDGNKIELWEPVDEEFEKVADGKTK